MSIPSEVLKKVQLLELKTRKVVNNQLAGAYKTVFRGQGMTFSDFREYVPGDDVRTISWSLMARTNKPYIKKFDEERELTVILAVDISGSSQFGSGENFKMDVMRYMSALVALSAIKNHDHVGLLLFSDRIEHYVPAKKSRSHVQRILRDLFSINPIGKKTDISKACLHLSGVLKKRSLIVLMSDFYDKDFELELRHLSKKHEVIASVVQSRLELEFPKMGLVDLEDPETGETLTVDSSSKYFQAWLKTQTKVRNEQRDKLLRSSQVDSFFVKSEDDCIQQLSLFFQRRHGRS
jgi:uncharacterized protein (DUF58 family)